MHDLFSGLPAYDLKNSRIAEAHKRSLFRGYKRIVLVGGCENTTDQSLLRQFVDAFQRADVSSIRSFHEIGDDLMYVVAALDNESDEKQDMLYMIASPLDLWRDEEVVAAVEIPLQ